jgi:hypothetical protein
MVSMIGLKVNEDDHDDDGDKHPCLMRDSNTRCQRPSNEDLRPRGHWDRRL